ncbi:MAG TPA: ABC transporter permease [Chryseolinea sp.]|nr:ABC transporter permease [Chryseolinea sp.]
MLSNTLTLALRNLVRNKAFTIINVTGLSLGIACALVIFTFVRYELSFDQDNTHAKDIFKIVQETKFADDTYYWNTTAYPLAEAIRNDFPDLAMVSQASGPVPRMFKIEDQHGKVSRYEEKYVLYVDRYYPQMFDFTWIQGDVNTALAQPNSVVLTETIARKYFGADGVDHSVLGRQILLNNKDALTVTGLIADALPTASLKYSMLIPYEFFRMNNVYYAGNWSGNYQGTTFVMLKGGQAPGKLEQQLAGWKKKYLKPEDDNRIDYRVQPLLDSHTNEKFGSAPQSYVMPVKFIRAAIAIAIFMIAIACMNFINLATAQAAGRAREVGVRKALGSSRLGLIKQFLGENALIVLMALFVSLGLAQLAIVTLNDLLAIIDLRLSLDRTTAVIIPLIGCAVLIMACLYPALVMASYRPVEALKNKISQAGGGLSLRRTLIVLQFSIVQLFIIGTLVIAVQMNYVQQKDMGFSKEDPVMLVQMNELEKIEAFRQKLLLNPAIKEVSFSSSSPLSEYNHHYGTSFRLPGQREEDGQEAEEKGVDENFLSFYGLQLLAGRNFSGVQEKFKEFIVNEKLIKGLGWTPEQAVGRNLIINEGEATIVGVIKDFHNTSLRDEITPCVLLNSSQWLDRANIKLNNRQNLSTTVGFIESVWKEIYPEGIYNAIFMEDSLAKNYALEQLVFKGFTAFSALTIIIGCLGLFGLLSFVTLRKTKEVGIRKVLGSSEWQIMGLFGKEFAVLVVVAFSLATPLCYYWMDQWLSDFAYHINLSWWMFGVGLLITLVIALCTISYHTLRAAMANPVEALRSE